MREYGPITPPKFVWPILWALGLICHCAVTTCWCPASASFLRIQLFLPKVSLVVLSGKVIAGYPVRLSGLHQAHRCFLAEIAVQRGLVVNCHMTFKAAENLRHKDIFCGSGVHPAWRLLALRSAVLFQRNFFVTVTTPPQKT